VRVGVGSDGGILMETPQDVSRLRLLFTTTYAAQCFAWMSFLVYLALIGPPALAVMVAFPIEISCLTSYFLQLSMFLAHNPWITYGLILWTSLTGAILLPRLLRLFPENGFKGSSNQFMAYAAILNTSFSLCLALLLMVVGTEALLGPIDCILEISFGSRLEFIQIILSNHCQLG